MAFSFNGLSGAAVTLSGAVTQTLLPTGATQIQKFQTRDLVANTPETYYTPTAGKTLYITTLFVGTNGATDNVNVGDNITGNAQQLNTSRDNGINVDTPVAASWAIHFPIPLKIVNALVGNTSTNANISIGFVGYEV